MGDISRLTCVRGGNDDRFQRNPYLPNGVPVCAKYFWRVGTTYAGNLPSDGNSVSGNYGHPSNHAVTSR